MVFIKSLCVRAEAGETNKAEHTVKWLWMGAQKKKKNHKLSSETTLKHNGIEAWYKK